MNLREIMDANGGFWDKEYAMVKEGQYVKCVAVGTENNFKLTPYGESLLANTSADVVPSRTKRSTKKPVEAPVADPVADELNLDDI